MNNKEIREFKEMLCEGVNGLTVELGEARMRVELEPKNLVLAKINGAFEDGMDGYEMVLTNVRFEFRKVSDNEEA